MARPKKETGSDEAKQISITQDNYFELINFIASQLQVQKNNAQKQLQIASAHLQQTQEPLRILKKHADLVMTNNEVKLDSLAKFQHIHLLLSTDDVEGTSTAGLPDAPAPADIKPIKPKKSRKERDPNAPKRPLTAFFLFLQDKRDETTEAMKKSDPGFKPGDVQKRNTELWNALPEEKQEPYKRRYEANLEKYKQDLEAYRAQGGQLNLEDEMHAHEAAEVGLVTDPALEAHANVAGAHDGVGVEEGQESDEKLDAEDSPEDSDESEESPPPKKEIKKPAGKAAKEASPEKKKKAAPVKEEKKSKKTKEPSKSASPEVSKKKRKVEEKDAPKQDKKKKPRKSQGYNGNDEDF